LSVPTENGGLTIGQVAERAGVRASAIRYYEEVGVLPAPERIAGQRRYTTDVLRRLAIVDVAQRAGFTLEEIAELLGPADGPAYEAVRALAERKLPAIDALIERAEAVKRWLEVATACECATLDVCALFDDHAMRLPGPDGETPPFVRGPRREPVATSRP
jgi:MerR family redox-sensitive transcriptional activator SoxR